MAFTEDTILTVCLRLNLGCLDAVQYRSTWESKSDDTCHGNGGFNWQRCRARRSIEAANKIHRQRDCYVLLLSCIIFDSLLRDLVPCLLGPSIVCLATPRELGTAIASRTCLDQDLESRMRRRRCVPPSSCYASHYLKFLLPTVSHSSLPRSTLDRNDNRFLFRHVRPFLMFIASMPSYVHLSHLSARTQAAKVKRQLQYASDLKAQIASNDARKLSSRNAAAQQPLPSPTQVRHAAHHMPRC